MTKLRSAHAGPQPAHVTATHHDGLRGLTTDDLQRLAAAIDAEVAIVHPHHLRLRLAELRDVVHRVRQPERLSAAGAVSRGERRDTAQQDALSQRER